MRLKLFAVIMWSSLFLAPYVSEAGASCLSEPELPPGGLSWPAVGQVERGWSLICTTDRGHRGIDIRLASDATIVSTADGVVAFTGFTPAEGGGMTISIDHPGGLRSTYIHVSEILVTPGDAVVEGQPLAGSDGNPLHFGLKSTTKSRYIDPSIYLPELPDGAADITADSVLSELPPAGTMSDLPLNPEPSTESYGSSLLPEVVAGNQLEKSLNPQSARPGVSPSVDADSTQIASAEVAIGAKTSDVGYSNPDDADLHATAETINYLAESGLESVTAGAISQSSWREPWSMRLPSPSNYQFGFLLGSDGLRQQRWPAWLKLGMEKPAGAGLLVSSLVLLAIRRSVWAPLHWDENCAGGA